MKALAKQRETREELREQAINTQAGQLLCSALPFWLVSMVDPYFTALADYRFHYTRIYLQVRALSARPHPWTTALLDYFQEGSGGTPLFRYP
ncbi:hypothetical protein [Corynebacterium efficiens]|uniref:hypothetical protein n=1 Tax=Corynebacterium efficiens TaxID=152794 RepID=UPI00117C784A|nr:hypothetical protein [Corynebacterium efficiens]